MEGAREPPGPDPRSCTGPHRARPTGSGGLPPEPEDRAHAPERSEGAIFLRLLSASWTRQQGCLLVSTPAGGPSLDDGKNFSRDAETADTADSDDTRQSSLTDHCDLSDLPDDPGRYDCRHAYENFEHEADDGETAPYRCNSWDCYCCAHRMRMNLIEDLERLVEERPELRRLLTLTISPERGPDDREEQHGYITDRFNAFRTNLTDRYPGLSYVWIRHEGDENGRPHLHLLVDRYLPQAELSELAVDAGLGEVVDIRRVTARNAAKYLTSYLGKGALAELPSGCRRYSSSSDISLDVRGGGDSDDSRDWTLMMDDYDVTPVHGDGPLRRRVTNADIYLQRVHGGPLGRPPPDS